MTGPLTTVVDAVARGATTRVRVVQAAITRLAATNPSLTYLAESCFDEALGAAAHADRENVPGRLAGAPTLVKDLEDLTGHQTRQGSRIFADAPLATADSLGVTRLRGAGAIVVGKSTLPEFAIEGYTANDLTGVTTNPWNPELSPGGSSGGSAVALSVGATLVATATDGGGSVRIPSALCGLVGLKPTNGLLGRYPEPDWIDLSTDGAMATSVEDLSLILSVLEGPIGGDPTAPPLGVGSLAAWRETTTALYVAERTSPWGPLDDDVARAFADAVGVVSDLLGLPALWRGPGDFDFAGDPDLDWYVTCATEHVHRLGAELVTAHWDELHVATQEFFTQGLATTTAQYLAARRRRFTATRVLDELLGHSGLLLTPVVTSSGWAADGTDETGEVHGLHPRHLATVIQNITGLPAISVPMGRLDSGLPFGLQITAPRYHERRLLELAARIEAAAPWPQSAPGYPTLAEALDLI